MGFDPAISHDNMFGGYQVSTNQLAKVPDSVEHLDPKR
jgi:hypothetical protein